MKGTWVVNGAFYAAGDDGARLDARTEALNAAAAPGTNATALRRLLGAPRSEEYYASCNFAGDNGLWVYDTFMVMTARPADAGSRYPSIDDAIAAEDAGAAIEPPYETVAAIEGTR